MPQAHTDGQSRKCGASTVVGGQTNVFVNGRLWAVAGDPNSHGGGELINSGTTVFINNINVIVHTPDLATVDGLLHLPSETETGEGSNNVYCYGN